MWEGQMEGTCCEMVYSPGAWRSHICGRKAKVEVHGKLYCGIHDPKRLQAIEDVKTAERNRKWERVRLIRRKSELLEDLGKLMISVMANNGNVIYVAGDARLKIVEYNDVVNKLEPKQEVANEA